MSRPVGSDPWHSVRRNRHSVVLCCFRRCCFCCLCLTFAQFGCSGKGFLKIEICSPWESWTSSQLSTDNALDSCNRPGADEGINTTFRDANRAVHEFIWVDRQKMETFVRARAFRLDPYHGQAYFTPPNSYEAIGTFITWSMKIARPTSSPAAPATTIKGSK